MQVADPLYKRYAVTSKGSDFLYARGFRIYFTPLPGFFSPFPHGTSSLSVDYEYLALEDGPPIFRQGFTCPALLVARLVPCIAFFIRDYHPLWFIFPDNSDRQHTRSRRLFRFRSPLLSESRLMSFPRATEMFQFTRFASHIYEFNVRYLTVGFPIRKSPDQSQFADSPKLIAGYHVLRRL